MRADDRSALTPPPPPSSVPGVSVPPLVSAFASFAGAVRSLGHAIEEGLDADELEPVTIDLSPDDLE